MILERTRFNKYSNPTYTCLASLDQQESNNILQQSLYNLYNLLIKNGAKYIRTQFYQFVQLKINELSEVYESENIDSQVIITKPLISSYNSQEFSVKIQDQPINVKELMRNLKAVIGDLNPNDNSAPQQLHIAEALLFLIGNKIGLRKKFMLFEVAGKAFGYKPTIDKRYVSNIFGFQNTGLFKFSVEYSKIQKKFYFLKQEIQYAVSGLNSDEVFENNFSDVVLNNMIQEDESIVNGSEVYSEELEESEIFCRPLPTRYTPNLDDNFNPLVQSNTFMKVPNLKKSKSISVAILDTSGLEENHEQIDQEAFINGCKSCCESEEIQEKQIECSFIENQGDDLLDNIQKQKETPTIEASNEIVDEDSTNINNSGKSHKNNIIRAFIGIEIPVEGDKKNLSNSSRYVHRNWIEKQIELDLTEQQKIMPLGYEIKRVVKSPRPQKDLFLQEVQETGEKSKKSKLKKKRSKSFSLQDKSEQLINLKCSSHLQQQRKAQNKNPWDSFPKEWNSQYFMGQIYNKLINRVITE